MWMQEPDDNDLLRAYVERDSEAAFAALVARHVNKVYSVAWRHTGNPHQAEEITQAVFVILARKSNRLGKSVILEGWLYQTARLTALTFIRGEIRRTRREQEVCMQTGLNESEPDVWAKMAPLLDAVMGKLNEHDRHAVVLRYFYGKSLKEVGAALGASEGAARVRLHRAMEKLRRYFLKLGIASTTATIEEAISALSVQTAPAGLVNIISIVAAGKGATTTTSTLALVNGAMKLMAWTKAKSAVIMGVAILLASAASVGLVKGVPWSWLRTQPDLQGVWEGVMLLDDAGVGPGEAARTHLVLILVKTNDVYTATTDLIEMGKKDVAMGRVAYDYPSLRIQRNPRDTWNLKVNADATQMILSHATHFIQPDPVLLMRTSAPDPVPKRLEESDFQPRPGSDLQGYWKGSTGDGQEALPFNLKVAELSDGTFRAEWDNPTEGADGLPAMVSYNRPLVKLTLASGAGIFQGAVNSNDTGIIGSWTQGGQSVPAIVGRADYHAEHAQDADKSYSSISGKDLQGHWRGSWVVTLAGTKATIRLALNIARLPGGSYAATLSDPDDFEKNDPVPTSDFHYAPPQVRMEWKPKGGAYEGKLSEGKLVGTWFQAGAGFPLIFDRQY
jgi:RNA polymerase sigma factor (sigma-70 family)